MLRHEQPISRIEWRDPFTLEHNDYNPNHVFAPEMRLLELSVLTTGWVQPILINPDGVIIDGFHRTTLGRGSKAIREAHGTEVPCAVLNVSRAEAMLMTIRMNRAKGTHAAVDMSRIVRELIDTHGMSVNEIMAGIGATRDEVDLLYQENVFKARNIKDWQFSKAWYPKEETKRG